MALSLYVCTRLCLQVISAFMLVSIVFIPIGVVSLFASRDVWLNETQFYALFVYSFLVLHAVDQENVSIRLLKLLIGMKLIAYQCPLEVIRSGTYKAPEIKNATEL